MPGGQRKTARRILPARASEHSPYNDSDQDALHAQTTPIPAPPSSHGLSNRRVVQISVVQDSTPTRQLGQEAAERESQL